MAMRSGRSILMSYAVQLVFAWKAIAMTLNEKAPYIWKEGFLILIPHCSGRVRPRLLLSAVMLPRPAVCCVIRANAPQSEALASVGMVVDPGACHAKLQELASELSCEGWPSFLQECRSGWKLGKIHFLHYLFLGFNPNPQSSWFLKRLWEFATDL